MYRAMYRSIDISLQEILRLHWTLWLAMADAIRIRPSVHWVASMLSPSRPWQSKYNPLSDWSLPHHPNLNVFELVVDAASTALMSQVTSKFQAISLGPDDSHEQNSACEYLGALPRTPSRPDVLLTRRFSCFDAPSLRGVTRRWPMVYQRPELFPVFSASFCLRIAWA